MMRIEPEERVRRERDLYRNLLKLGEHDEPDRFVQETLQVLVALSNARCAYLELRDDTELPTFWWAADGCDPAQVRSIRETISSGIIAEALATGQTVTTASAVDDPRFRDFSSVKEENIESVLCVPMGRDVPLGVVYLQGDRDSPG